MSKHGHHFVADPFLGTAARVNVPVLLLRAK